LPEGARRIAAAIDALSERTGRSLSWLMPAMVLVIAFEVVARYVFSAPTIWAYDSALILYAWLGLVGGAFAMKRGAHIRVDLFTARLSPRRQALLELAAAPLIAFFLLLVVWQVGLAAFDAWETGSRRPTEWAPPLLAFLIAAPLGAALLLLQLAAQMIKALDVLIRDGEAR
jgi:TRAP-type mannitol/chloroaromatic compound transport system permease small subunit